MSKTVSDDFWHNMPESKLELIGGRLIAGNSLAGSRYLLWAILRTLGPQAALPLAPPELWWQALASAFQAPALLSSPRAWQAWADQVEHTPLVEPIGTHFDWRHYDAYSDLMMGLHIATHEDAGVGRSIQRFVMRLGDQGFMPDLQLIRRDRLHLFQTYYVDGPADLVVEVVLPGHAAQDAKVKRRLYADGGVPEYWIVDPAARTFDVLRLTDDGYTPQSSDAEGRYRSARIPGLVCEPAKLWACLDSPEERRRSLTSGAVSMELGAPTIESRTKPNDADEWHWDRPPFAPPLGLRRTPISFEQFIAWCPEAKFELVDGKPYIGGWQGTRDLLGLLLMTFGLEETATLLHPRDWVAGLLAEEEAHLHDAGRRDAWWTIARQTAEFLRERLGPLRLAVIGDLVWPAPLHFWSKITLVMWDLPKRDHMFYSEFYRQFPEPEIELLEAENASPSQCEAIEREAIIL